MKDRLKALVSVLAKAEEFEVYALIGIVSTTLVLELFGWMPEHWVPVLTLAVLTLLAVAILRLRARVDTVLSRPNTTVKLFHDAPAHNIKAAFREGRDVLLSGTALSRTLRNHLPDIRYLLAQGGHLRLLMLNPDSPYAEAAALRSPQEGGYRTNQSDFIKASLRDVEALTPSKKGSIEIRLSNYPFSFGAILVDPDLASASLHLRYYTYRSIEHEGPYFNLYPPDETWYEHFRHEVEAIWRDAAVHKVTGVARNSRTPKSA